MIQITGKLHGLAQAKWTMFDHELRVYSKIMTNTYKQSGGEKRLNFTKDIGLENGVDGQAVDNLLKNLGKEYREGIRKQSTSGAGTDQQNFTNNTKSVMDYTFPKVET